MSQSSLTHHDLDPETLRLNLPESPGVYLFKDSSDKVIYIGKAKNLKKRVLSYFKPSGGLSHKTQLMMRRAQGLDYILTATENEAFILEDSLVKRHMPRYNIILRDDKRFPCLRLDVEDTYPRLNIVRKIKRDGALYFGPYSSANAVRSTLKLINRIFHLRKCKSSALPKRSRACLNYQLDRCFGPCAHDVDHVTYRDVINQVRLFLEGRNQELVRQLKKNMESIRNW
ncbi:MAG: GIY-YIG nuclease family protein [Deltaproteobacteria bacterium]|nr:GIY-YIG nuclease family protein [Deltaproteobacteria bacterium]